MSLIEKLISKRSPTASVSPVAQFERDLDAAIGAAERRGVPIYAIVAALERAENAERYRMAASLRF